MAGLTAAAPSDDVPARIAENRPRRFGLWLGVVAIAALTVGLGGGYLASQPQVSSANAEVSDLVAERDGLVGRLLSLQSERDGLRTELNAVTATVDKLTAGRDPVVLKIPFSMPEGYPTLVDIGSVPEHMQDALDTGTGQAVAVAPGVWAAYPPGATVESAVIARAFDGYCASKAAFEAQYLAGESTPGTCW